jgi:microcystin-dependent protein
MDPFIGEIRLFAGSFAPRDWVFCDGQLMQVAQNTALFSILGTTYGGDGRTTFALPDLRGRVPVHPGTGPGLTTRQLGQKAGAETAGLTIDQMPAHGHRVTASDTRGDSADPANNVPAGDPDMPYIASGATAMAADMVQQAGGGQDHANMQPFLGLNYIIALVGIYPSRS